MSDFDYGGEVAVVVSKFKTPTVGPRNARLFGLMRVGTFREEYKQGNTVTIKDPAPQAIAIFHLMGKEDKNDDDSPMFFTKSFPLKKGDKSFLHSKFIPALGGMAKHTGFSSMIQGIFSLTLKGGTALNDDGTPKYVNFDTMGALAEDMLELVEEQPKYAAVENPVGFLTESELTKEALEYLHPTREFYGIVMQTEEFKEGTHPCQALIQEIYDADKDRYTPKKKDDKDQDAPQEGTNAPKDLAVKEDLADTNREF